MGGDSRQSRLAAADMALYGYGTRRRQATTGPHEKHDRDEPSHVARRHGENGAVRCAEPEAKGEILRGVSDAKMRQHRPLGAMPLTDTLKKETLYQ